MIQDIFPGQGKSLIFDKIRKQFKFFKAQVNTLSVHAHLMGCLIQHDTMASKLV